MIFEQEIVENMKNKNKNVRRERINKSIVINIGDGYNSVNGLYKFER